MNKSIVCILIYFYLFFKINIFFMVDIINLCPDTLVLLVGTRNNTSNETDFNVVRNIFTYLLSIFINIFTDKSTWNCGGKF